MLKKKGNRTYVLNNQAV